MKATDLLKKQHRIVNRIFKKLLTGRSDAPPLLKELAADLAAHMAIEQDILYPVARKVDESLVLESYEEHALAELALKRVLATAPKDETFAAKVTALKELIEHHVEEEEGELFPKLEKKLGAPMLKDLGKKMEAKFDEVKARGFAASVPKGSRTSADAPKKHAPNGMKAASH